MDTTINSERDKGFTLIELLIVIVILGILATITVFAVSGITDRGQKSACDADYRTLESALEAYYAREGNYPANMDDLTTGTDRLMRSPTANHSFNSTTGVITATGECAVTTTT